MSRWDSRTVPASARRAGRAAVTLVGVVVSWACTVMAIPSLPRSNSSLDAPRGHTCTGCDDCSARASAGTAARVSVSASS